MASPRFDMGVFYLQDDEMDSTNEYKGNFALTIAAPLPPPPPVATTPEPGTLGLLGTGLLGMVGLVRRRR